MTSTVKAANFLMLRTPALPLSQLAEVRAAFDRDGTVLNAETLKLPIVREALFLASERVHNRIYEPEMATEHDPKFEMSVARYLVRMCTRCTPFGAFATISSGSVGDETSLEVGTIEETARSVRIDAAIPWHLRDSLFAAGTISLEVVRKTRLTCNSSIWKAPDGFRYVEARGLDKARAYFTARVSSTPAIQRVLEVMAAGDKGDGMAFSDLASKMAEDFGTDLEAAENFILGLVRSQLLTCLPVMSVTGDDVVNGMVRDLIALDGKPEATAALEKALAALDQVGTDAGANVDAYKQACVSLKKVKPDVNQANAVQVDLFRPANGLALSSKFTARLQKQIEEARAILVAPGSGQQSFHDRFKEKFGDEAVPLLQALDEDYGVSFGPDQSQRGGSNQNPGASRILQRLVEACRSGEKEILLTPKDLAAFGKGAAFPGSFTVGGMFNAADAAALEDGNFSFDLTMFSGGTCANLAGRFCAGSAEIAEGTRRLIADAEQDHGDTIYAEIAHLPEGRIGNVIVRPVLRQHEIVYLGRSGAPDERQIPVSDIVVQCVNNRVELFSLSRRKRIIPRLTNAHSFASPMSLPIYRFLGLLQYQHEPAFGVMVKGIGQGFGFIPGIRYRNIRLTRPRWRLTSDEIKAIAQFEGDELSENFTQLLRGGDIKGIVRLVKFDNFLQLDLTARLDRKILKEECRRKDSIELEEVLATEPSPVMDREGRRFNHELIMSFTSHNPLTKLPPAPLPAWSGRTAGFAPGQDWLYARLYASSQVVEQLVCDAFPAISALAEKHGCRTPFFLRYNENGHHLRLRVFGEGRRSWRGFRDELESLLEPYWRDRAISRIEYGTYFPETQRYGGPAGIGLCEEIFAHDSIMVAQALARLRGYPDALLQHFNLALISIFHLMRAFELGGDAEITLLEEMKNARQRQFNISDHKLNESYRNARKVVEQITAGAFLLPDRFGDLIGERHEAIAPLVRTLKQNCGAQQLNGVIGSLIHMTANRIFIDNGSQKEVSLAHFLAKAMKSRKGREKFQSRQREQAERQPEAALAL